MFPYSFYMWLLVILQCCILVRSEQVKITRASNGDRFSTKCCNCCQNYNAFCAPPNDCQCNNELSYYNDTDQYSCFTKSEILNRCIFGISTNSLHHDKFSFKFANTDIELGTLFMRNKLDINNMKKCHLNSIQYDGIPNWTPCDISDFQLINSKNELKLKFVGNPNEYYGKLLKLMVTCNGEKSCLMFKVEGKIVANTKDVFNRVLKTTLSPRIEDKNQAKSKWMIWVIIGVVFVFILVICVAVCVVKRRKRTRQNHKSSKKYIKKSKEVLTAQTDDNRNSIHDKVAMYVSHEDHVELSSAYVDPDDVFNKKDSSKKIKNPNYDYAYSHSALPQPPAEKHEYMDIAPDHPYAEPAPLPCPDSRKSLGYALLKGVDDVKEPPSPSLPSEYQSLTLEENDTALVQDDDGKPPGSPEYFQLDHDHAI